MSIFGAKLIGVPDIEPEVCLGLILPPSPTHFLEGRGLAIKIFTITATAIGRAIHRCNFSRIFAAKLCGFSVHEKNKVSQSIPHSFCFFGLFAI